MVPDYRKEYPHPGRRELFCPFRYSPLPIAVQCIGWERVQKIQTIHLVVVQVGVDDMKST